MSSRGRHGRPSRRTRQAAPIRYHIRDDYNPVNFLDFFDRHLSRATASGKDLALYLLLIFGISVLAVGIMVAVHVAGLSPWVAVALGLAGAGVGRIALVRQRARNHIEGDPDRSGELISGESTSEPSGVDRV